MSEVFRLGKDAKVYRNTNTYLAPTWVEVDIVKDAALNLSAGEWDGSRRGSGGWKQMARTMKEAKVELDIVHAPADAGYIALRSAFIDGGGIDLMVLDGSKDVAGNEGLRAEMDVFGFSRDEKLEAGIMLKISVAPRPSSNEPDWVVTT